MDVLIGKAVVVEHPFLYERHVVALVVGQTAKTLLLRYWDARRGDWKEDESRRKVRKAIVLGSSDAASVQAVHDELVAMSDNHVKSQKALTVQYHQSVANLGAATL